MKKSRLTIVYIYLNDPTYIWTSFSFKYGIQQDKNVLGQLHRAIIDQLMLLY